MAKLTHTDESGRARMVDVGDKPVTRRRALAEGSVRLSSEALAAVAENRLSKGDALSVARLAGVQAAKRTAEWIPLCHSVPLGHVEVTVRLDESAGRAVIRAAATAEWRTGVEMEAMVAVSAACLALYDMVKAVDREAVIDGIRLLEKSGGRSGDWRRSG